MKTDLEPWKNNLKPWKPWKIYLEPWKAMKTDLEPLKTIKNQLEPWKTMKTTRNHENQPGTIKTNREPWKTMKTYLGPWKTNLEPWNTMKTDLEPWKTNLEPWKTTKTDPGRAGISKNITDRTFLSYIDHYHHLVWSIIVWYHQSDKSHHHYQHHYLLIHHLSPSCLVYHSLISLSIISSILPLLLKIVLLPQGRKWLSLQWKAVLKEPSSFQSGRSCAGARVAPAKKFGLGRKF